MAFSADLDLSRERTLQSRVWELTAENAKLRAALEWYAADHTPEQMVWDDGIRAREALNELKD